MQKLVIIYLGFATAHANLNEYLEETKNEYGLILSQVRNFDVRLKNVIDYISLERPRENPSHSQHSFDYLMALSSDMNENCTGVSIINRILEGQLVRMSEERKNRTLAELQDVDNRFKSDVGKIIHDHEAERSLIDSAIADQRRFIIRLKQNAQNTKFASDQNAIIVKQERQLEKMMQIAVTEDKERIIILKEKLEHYSKDYKKALKTN